MNTIQENNKIIAEFLGYVNTTPTDKDFNIYEGENKVLPNLIETNFEKRFHTDWNWLMSVVEEIERLGFEVQIYKSTCMIYKVGNNLSIGKDAETKIEAVYNACVEFIKWYNEQNK